MKILIIAGALLFVSISGSAQSKKEFKSDALQRTYSRISDAARTTLKIGKTTEGIDCGLEIEVSDSDIDFGGVKLPAYLTYEMHVVNPQTLACESLEELRSGVCYGGPELFLNYNTDEFTFSNGKNRQVLTFKDYYYDEVGMLEKSGRLTISKDNASRMTSASMTLDVREVRGPRQPRKEVTCNFR